MKFLIFVYLFIVFTFHKTRIRTECLVKIFTNETVSLKELTYFTEIEGLANYNYKLILKMVLY